MNRKWGAFCLGQFLGYVAIGVAAFQSELARTLFLAIGVALLLGPLAIAASTASLRMYRDRFRMQRHPANLEAEAAELGLGSYGQESSPITLLLQQLPMETEDVRFKRVFSGTVHGRKTRIFDFWYREPAVLSEEGAIGDLTCALLSLDSPLPVVAIKRADFGRRLLKEVGWRGALATGDGAFDKRFELRAAGQEAVSRVLTHSVRSTLLADETLYLAQISDTLLYCSKLIDLSSRRDLLERATHLHTVIH